MTVSSESVAMERKVPFQPPERRRPERPDRPGPASGPPAGPTPFALTPTGLVGWLALLTLARLLAAAATGLAPDEAYYRLWALAPAWGYLDHPPMVAFFIAGGIALVGDDALGIRVPMVAATLVASLAVWRIAILVAGDLATAGRAALWFNATLLVGVGGVLATPDVPALLFWTLSLWALAELRASADGRWWLAVGLFAGLGLLSKYSGLFLGAGIVLWLLVVPDARRWFRSLWLWAGGALALLAASPVAFWNATNDWASFAKQFGRAAPREFRPELVLEFIGAEILLVGPLMVPFLILGIAKIVRLPPSRASLAWLLLASSLPFVLYLLVHALHARVQGNWPMALMAAVAIIAAVAAADLPAGRAGAVLARLRPLVAPFGIGLALLAFVHGATDAAFLTDRDQSKRMRGWEDFAATLELERRAAGARFIGTVGYGVTGELAFALRGQGVPVVALDETRRYGNFPPAPLASLGPGLVVVLERRIGRVDLKALFSGVEPGETLTRSANGIVIRRFRTFRVAGATADMMVHPIPGTTRR